jgi:hypothetical protein
MKITIEQAYEVWRNRANGAEEGHSDGKGGRAWLSGEFQLCELEALCMILRHEAGRRAEGLPELLKNMRSVPRPEELSKNQVAIVKALVEHDSDYVLTFDHIAADTGIKRSTVRLVVRALARVGVTEYVRGVMTDEGEVCGSGYRLTESGRWIAGEL